MSDLRDKIADAIALHFAETDTPLDAADAVLAVIDLDKVRAEAQVAALREVAKDREWLDAAARTGMNGYGGPFAGNAAKGVRDCLYARANRIAREAGIETGAGNDRADDPVA